MALKTQYIFYTARNFSTGLSDVKAQKVTRNGVQVATDVALVEVDAVNAPGLYKLEVLPATITTYGGAGTYMFYVNSDSGNKNAPAVAKVVVTVNDNDDLEAHLVSIETKIDTIDTEVGLIQGDVTSIKSTVEDTNTEINNGTTGLVNIKTLIDTAISAINSIQNNTSFVAVIPSQLIVPDTGTNTYKMEIRVFDAEGNPEDPNTDQIKCSIENQGGTDRTNLITGFISGPVDATKDAVGKYHIIVAVADTVAIEQLNFMFEYTEGVIVKNFPRTSETVQDQLATGFALQSTLLDVLTDTADIQPKVTNIENILENVTYGNEALKDLILIIDGVVDSNNSLLTNGTYGLSALKTILDTLSTQTSVDNLQTCLTDIKGAGFDTLVDSLTVISARLYEGGGAQ